MRQAVVELMRSATALHAATLWQPWATAVAELGKDVENRGWEPPAARVGGLLAVHAGLTYDMAGAASIERELGLRVPGRSTCVKGAVLAVARLARVVKDSRSRWAIPGQHHWCLADVVRLEQPVPCRGAQGLWPLPSKVLEEARAQVLARESMRAAMVGLSPTEGPPSGFEKALAEAAAATRVSNRQWSKGSARGAGPSVSTGSVLVAVSNVQPCLWCGAMFHGTTGEPHAPTIARHRGEGWPGCEHAGRWLEDCQGFPVAPECCRARWQAVGGPLLATWVAREVSSHD